MCFNLNAESLRTLWAQLYLNIGYSKHYQRYVMVEPLCYFFEQNSIVHCASVDRLVYPQVGSLGKLVADYIDLEWGDCIEQVLIFDKRHNIIILTDEELIFTKQRLPEFLTYLSKDLKVAQKILGLVHYHVDEPQLSIGDIEAIDYFTAEIKRKGGNDQIGLIVSERNPTDTLNSLLHGQNNFENHISSKLRKGSIDVVGRSFNGKNRASLPIEVTLTF